MESKKLRKKLTKTEAQLKKSENIVAVQLPSKILCVSNAGLDCNVGSEEVQAIFSKYGQLDDVIMLPRKPYCFVCFLSQQDAEKAYSELNGFTLKPSSHRQTTLTWYILYVQQVPSNLSPSSEMPPDLKLVLDFVSEDYGQKLFEFFFSDSDNEAAQKELKHRQVKHYGYEFKYGINDVDINEPLNRKIPDLCDELLQKALRQSFIGAMPDQLTVNIYQPGQGIPPHVDTPEAFEDGILSLSLRSQVVMDFRKEGKHLTVLLPPNSLLVMKGESRYLWTHGITPRKSDIVTTAEGGVTLQARGMRMSLTFRKIIPPKERLKREIPYFKKSFTETLELPISNEEAAKLESSLVHKVYDQIADHFSGTRHSPWPKIAGFLQEQPVGSLIADIGCGNGKYLGINSYAFCIGSDRCPNLTAICQSRNFQVFLCDVLAIPLCSEKFDVCICIAVLHHLSTEERRLKGICELLRILRPGGKALIYVWAMEQEMGKVKSKYLRQSPGTCTTVQQDPDSGIDAAENSAGKSYSHQCESQCKETNQSNFNSSENTLGSCSNDKAMNSEKCIRDNCLGDLSSDNANSLESKHAGKIDRMDEEKQKLMVHTNRTKFKQQDMLVPWQLKSKTQTETSNDVTDKVFHRYYHVFKQGEIELLCEKVRFCKVIDGYYDQGNWAVILEKHADYV